MYRDGHYISETLLKKVLITPIYGVEFETYVIYPLLIPRRYFS